MTVRIPTGLRPFANGAAEITVDADTLSRALSAIEEHHPGLCARILTPEGDIRPFVNLFVGDTSARFMEGLNTPVSDGEIISIIPAVAGGRAEKIANRSWATYDPTTRR